MVGLCIFCGQAVYREMRERALREAGEGYHVGLLSLVF
jgi:hypothetical protein